MKGNVIKQREIWKERKCYKEKINMKRKRISFMLTSAPCSTKNVTISIEFILMAILRGHSLIYRELHITMINIAKKIIS